LPKNLEEFYGIMHIGISVHVLRESSLLINLDWYHVEKKCKERLGMAMKEVAKATLAYTCRQMERLSWVGIWES
jgi:hypothetical protein